MQPVSEIEVPYKVQLLTLLPKGSTGTTVARMPLPRRLVSVIVSALYMKNQSISDKCNHL